jgi:hypothetical protein
MSIIIASSVVLIALVLALVKLTRHFSTPQRLPVTADWIEDLSIERYRPMLRLLDEEDFEFLRNQPGFTSAMATKLRIQRCQIFRAYLHNLETDFQRVCMAIKAILLHSNIDRPDLASALIRREVTFAYRTMSLHVQVLLFRCGIGTADVSGLLNLFDGMRLELRTLVPAEMAAGA